MAVILRIYGLYCVVVVMSVFRAVRVGKVGRCSMG